MFICRFVCEHVCLCMCVCVYMMCVCMMCVYGNGGVGQDGGCKISPGNFFFSSLWWSMSTSTETLSPFSYCLVSPLLHFFLLSRNFISQILSVFQLPVSVFLQKNNTQEEFHDFSLYTISFEKKKKNF